MARLKPNDLDNSTLRITMKGYDRAQVDVLLERARNEVATLTNELNNVREELDRQRKVAESLQGQENMLKDTLILAQRTADDVKASAQREADAIVSQAHRSAEESQRQLTAKINDLRWELERLRNERQRFAGEFRTSLENCLRVLAEDNFLTTPTHVPPDFDDPLVDIEPRAVVEA